MQDNYFLKMIKHLWQHEEVVLYNNVLSVAEQESTAVRKFLQSAYKRESIDYPYKAPEFDGDAALWGAKTIYFAAQLLLYRENKESELEAVFEKFAGNMTASTIVSADLCLRFLPEIVKKLKVIDSEDALIAVLEEILKTWHYSAINYALETADISFEAFKADPCLHQLYANRVIDKRNLKLARLEPLQDLILANLGAHAPVFWNEMTTKNNHE